MRGKLFVLMFVFVMILVATPFVLAESIGKYPQGSTINITNFCNDGGCSGIDLISIEYPDGSSEILNQAMTMEGQKGFYEFSNSYQIGTYYFTATGSNGITNVDSFDIGGGDLGFFIVGFILLYGLLIYSISIRNSYLGLISCFGLTMLGIYTSFNGVGDFKNSLTSVISYVTLAVGLGFGFESIRDIIYST